MARNKFIDREGAWQQTLVVQPHENRLYRELRDILSPDVLRANAEDQKLQRSPKKGVMMQFSPGDYQALVRAVPDLESKDKVIRTQAWQRISRDPSFKRFHRTRFPGEDTFHIKR